MSGVEAVGLVLGTIPLIISAFEHYADGIHTTRRLCGYRWELKSYSITLRTEWSIFRNTSTWLLTGIAEPLAIERLVSDPADCAWKDDGLTRNLQRRLGESHAVFFELMEDINSALDEFRHRLGLDDQGKIPWSDKHSLKAAFKAGKIILSKGYYDDLIARIKEDNRQLKELTSQTMNLQTLRRGSRSITNLENIRRYASVLYNAVGGALNCTCINKHRAGLYFGISTSSEDIPQAFRILLAKGSLSDTCGSEWLPLSVEVLDENAQAQRSGPISGVKPALSSQVPGTQRGKATQRGRKSVSFVTRSSPFVAGTASQSQSQSKTGSNRVFTIPTAAIRDLCIRLQQLQLASIPPTLGWISTGTMKFSLKRCDYFDQEPLPAPLFLSHVLNGKSSRRIQLSQMDKMNLSIAMSSAVLSLHQTPWMPQELVKQDVMVFKRRQNVQTSAYVTTNLGAELCTGTTQTSNADELPAYIENRSLFTLGIILIELLFGVPIVELREDEKDPHGLGWDMQYAVACRLLKEEQVLEEGGKRYERAVRSCIKCNFGPEVHCFDLKDEKFRKAVYDNIVAQLEDFASEFQRVR